MTKVLVVDDEQGQVKEMTEIIKALRPDYAVDGVLSAGEALGRIGSRDYDAVITDIRMPGMDGLELVGKLSQSNPGMLTVILSGYGEFQYAKKAIEYGVIEYLMKPVSKKDLLRLLDRIDARCAENRLKRREEALLRSRLDQFLPAYLERQLNKWTTGELNGAELAEIEDLFPDKGPGFVLAALFGGADRRAEADMASFKRRIDAASSQLLEAIQQTGRTIMFWLESRRHCAIFVVQPEHPGDFVRDRLKHRLETETEQLEAEFGLSIRIGAGPLSPSLFNEIQESCRQCMLALDYHFYCGSRRCVSFTEVKTDMTGKPPDLYELESTLSTEINKGNRATLSRILDETFDALCRNPTRILPGRLKEYCVYLATNLAEKMKDGPNDGIEQILREHTPNIYESDKCEKLKKAMKDVVDDLAVYRSGREASGNETIVEQCKAYIDRNYMKDLSLETLAAFAHFNPSYLSNLFSMHAGIGYSEYLTKVRIRKARELLAGTDRKVYEIASLVGYADPTYFIKMFKRETGLSPRKYRQLVHRQRVRS